MKKLVILFLAIALSASIQAALSKTVPVAKAGTLHTYFTAGELTTVTDLTVTGSIDARDFKFMRDTLTVLAKLNISAVNITAFSGTNQTVGADYYEYNANTIPSLAFSNTILTQLLLPESISTIENQAIINCFNLTYIVIPASVTKIGLSLFTGCGSLSKIQFNNTQPAITDVTVYTLRDLLGIVYPCTIYVPTGSFAKYFKPVNGGGWGFTDPTSSNFTLQEGVITASKESRIDASESKYIVSRHGNNAIISGLTIGESATIYNLQGTVIYNQVANAESMAVSLPAHGVYVVRVGLESVKVVY